MNLLKTAVILLGTVTVSNLLAPHPLAVFAESQIQEKLQVATLLENTVQEAKSESLPDTDEYIIEKLVEPAAETSNETDLTDGTGVSIDPKTEQIIIAIRKSWQTGDAALYLNNHEVMRFRTEVGEMTPYQRAQIVAQRLYQYLINEGDLEAIKPATANGETVIKMGEDILVTIDADTAKASQNPVGHLARIWTNLVRKSLGVDELPMPQVASGFVSTGKVQKGMASWYGPGFQGRRTASGTRFNMYEMTAAHKHLPFGTLVKVYNHRTQKACVVKITDRGPYAHGRIIDLSKAAAQAIGMNGTAQVTLEVVRPTSADEQIASSGES